MVQVSLENVITHVRSSLKFYWIHDNFQHIEYQNGEPSDCDNNSLSLSDDYSHCLNYSFVNKENKRNHYFIFFQGFNRYPPRMVMNLHFIEFPTFNKILMSWIEANFYCKSIGGTLPIIRDKNELAEIISLLKLSKDILPLEGLYIGLIRNSKHKVMSDQLSIIIQFCGNLTNKQTKQIKQTKAQ